MRMEANMEHELQSKINKLLQEWHESGRDSFERSYQRLDYDSPTYCKTAKERRKYVALDAGRSGAFLLDKETGSIYTIKAYGVPKRKIGHIDKLQGSDLRALRYA